MIHAIIEAIRAIIEVIHAIKENEDATYKPYNQSKKLKMQHRNHTCWPNHGKYAYFWPV